MRCGGADLLSIRQVSYLYEVVGGKVPITNVIIPADRDRISSYAHHNYLRVSKLKHDSLARLASQAGQSGLLDTITMFKSVIL